MRVGVGVLAVAILGCAGSASEPEVSLLLLKQEGEICRAERLDLPSGAQKLAWKAKVRCTSEEVARFVDSLAEKAGIHSPRIAERDLFRKGDTVEDERLIEALRAASGSKPELWHLQEPVAWAFRTWEEGYWEEAMPVLVHVQDRWVPIHCESAKYSLTLYWLEQHDRWLLFSDNDHSHLVELKTGRQVWSGPGKALLWPEGSPMVTPPTPSGDGAGDASSD